MKKDELSYFEIIEPNQDSDFETKGILFINDISGQSDFMFTQWNLLTIRPKSNLFKTTDLLDCINKKMSSFSNSNQETFFMVTRFSDKIKKNFEINLSQKSNISLLEPVVGNFEASSQFFDSSTNCTNELFQAIEGSFQKVSCFELVFNRSEQNIKQNMYPKERIFEETLIFANLAVSNRL